MFGWIPFIIYIFRYFGPQQAVVSCFIGAWLFLPEASFPIQGLPDYTKISATCYGILLATLTSYGKPFRLFRSGFRWGWFDLVLIVPAALIYYAKHLRSFRLSWFDLPMLIWCLCPFASSIANGLGWYDGLSASLAQTIFWGGPYFLGRFYLNSLAGLKRLAIGIFWGGLIYVPLCLYEVRMSPQLHNLIYGYHPHSFAQTMRYGGFRPTVFMQHGLMVGMWIMAATLVGIWLWKTGVLRQLWGIPMPYLVITLIITLILVKSTGAYVYMLAGLVILFIARWFRTAVMLLLLTASILFYLYLGSSGNLNGDRVVSWAATIFNEDRAGSLEFRIDNEEILAEKARQQPIFGWGGWGRSRVYEENWAGELVDITTTDSLWIITFGEHGYVGLISLTTSMLLPVVGFCCLRYPAKYWSHRQVAPAAVLAVVVVLYMLDCTLNAMINPVFILACGGISGLVQQEKN
jgi:hypothetical protein